MILEFVSNMQNNHLPTVWHKLLSSVKIYRDDSVCLVLGDNIFHGNGLSALLREAVHSAECDKKATVFGYWVSDPERYGVAEFDKEGNCLSIEENRLNPNPIMRGRAVFLPQ